MIYILDMGGSMKDTTSKKKKDRDKTDVHCESRESYDNREHHDHHSKISKKTK